MCGQPNQASPGAAWRNWQQQMPLKDKLRIGWRNTKIKFATKQPCCGHPGQPGC